MTTLQHTTGSMPSSSIDLFADTALDDPYPLYEVLRRIGPAVWLERHDAWFVGRYGDVKAALSRPEIFSSENGIALTTEANRQFLNGTVLAAGGMRHVQLRRPLSQQLASRAVKSLIRETRSRAEHLATEYISRRGTFDAVELATEFVAGQVVHLLGLPDSTRPELVASAAATFDMFGPDNARYRDATPLAAAMMTFLSSEVSRATVRPGSWMADLYRAADDGDIGEDDVVPLMSAYTTAGMDTTIHGITAALHHLADHLRYFKELRAGRIDAAAVFEEAIRLDAPVQGFGRRVTRDTRIGDTRIRKGEQVWLSFGSSGRDPRRWGSFADTFRPGRTGGDLHLALGHGPHACAGRHLALAQAASLLEALAHYGTRLEPAGNPVRARNNILHGWETLPLTITPDRRRTSRPPSSTGT
ncbi:cytochrome P450 [Streptomyces sp. NPDC059943]|uniref:cytochrome P450 n=1 Tax=Streptomyces sp. NPDC059943 TaxID=3347010 RepID=UPI003657C8D3